MRDEVKDYNVGQGQYQINAISMSIATIARLNSK